MTRVNIETAKPVKPLDGLDAIEAKVTKPRILVVGWLLAFFFFLLTGIFSVGLFSYVCGMFGYVSLKKTFDAYTEVGLK